MGQRLFSKSALVFWGLVTLAFTLRAVYFNQTIDYIQPGVGSDSYFYLEWARDIVRGNVIGREVFYALPAYPYFLSLVYIFAAGETFNLILLHIFLGAINCGLIYLAGKKLLNEAIGGIAGLIASAYFMFFFYDRMILPTTLVISLSLLLLIWLLKVRESPRLISWVASGLFLGICVLAGAAFALLAIFILAWMLFEYSQRALKLRLLYCLSFVLPFFLTIGAVTLRNYYVAGDAAVLTAHSGINFYIGNNPRANGLLQAPAFMRVTQAGLIEDAHIIAEQRTGRRLKPSQASNFWVKQAFSFIQAAPLRYLKLLGKKFLLFCSGQEFIDEITYYIYNKEARVAQLPFFKSSLIIPLAISGMFLLWPQRKKIIFLYLFVFSVAISTILFFINSRYRIASVPFLIIFAAGALRHFLEKFKARKYKSLGFCLILFLSLYFLTNLKITEPRTHTTSTFHYNKGVIFSAQGRQQEAKAEFFSALKLNPYDFMGYLGLGNIYYEQKEFTKAEEFYRKSLAINPYFIDAHFNLGFVCKEMGEMKQAEREFKQVLTLKPKDYSAHYNLGRIYQKRGLSVLALMEYQQALELNPDNWEILQAIAEVKTELLDRNK